MENFKYSAAFLVKEILNLQQAEMTKTANQVLEDSFKTMLHELKYEDSFSYDYVRGVYNKKECSDSALIQEVLKTFTEVGYSAEYLCATDSFKISVPQTVFVETAKILGE